MNAFAKFVLIPLSEYVSLKRQNNIESILLSNASPDMQKNSLGKFYKDHPISRPQMIENVEHPIKAPNLSTSFTPEIFSTPQSSPIRNDDDGISNDDSLSLLLQGASNSKGQILDSLNQPIKGSDQRKLKQYLTSDTAVRGPPGIRKVIKTLSKESEKSGVKNPAVKKKISQQRKKNQEGGSYKWSNLVQL